MIPPTKDVTMLSTLSPDDVVQMSIDPTAARHLMTILANIYSDNQLAIIREYITNALDSHIAAGQDRPVEVYSPSRLHPMFVVKDYGEGMSVEDIRNIYALYGASTKRNTQEQAGSIGIGAKSALAYGTQFTVTAIKDGEQAVVLVSLDENGDGIMEVLTRTPTDEPNGVQVSIPVTDGYSEFNQKLDFFHMCVEPGKLLVDGRQADRSNWHEVSDNMFLTDNSKTMSQKDFIVMGNVPYPIDPKRYSFNHVNQVIIYVPMGSVHFAPSREELIYDAFTCRTLDKYLEDFKKKLPEYLQKLIDQEPDRTSAFNKQEQLLKKMPVGSLFEGFSYRGKLLPQWINLNIVDYSTRDYDSGCRSGVFNCNSISKLSNSIWISNFDVVKFTSVHAKKIIKYMEDNNINIPPAYHGSYRFVLLSEDYENLGMFDNIDIHDYNDVKKTKLARNKANTVRKYLGLGGDKPYGAHEPDPSKNLWYGSKQEIRSAKNELWRYRMKEFAIPGHEFYYVADNELKKFLKKYPKAQHYKLFYVQEIEKFIQNLTDEDRKTLEFRDHVDNCEYLDAARIDDPELRLVVERKSSNGSALLDKYLEIRGYLNKIGMSKREDLIKRLPQSRTQELFDRYPLLVHGRFYRQREPDVLTEHLINYCNQVYANAMVEETTTRKDS